MFKNTPKTLKDARKNNNNKIIVMIAKSLRFQSPIAIESKSSEFELSTQILARLTKTMFYDMVFFGTFIEKKGVRKLVMCVQTVNFVSVILANKMAHDTTTKVRSYCTKLHSTTSTQYK